MSVRRILAACALIALVALHFDYKLASFPSTTAERFHRAFTAMPDARWGEYPQEQKEGHVFSRLCCGTLGHLSQEIDNHQVAPRTHAG